MHNASIKKILLGLILYCLLPFSAKADSAGGLILLDSIKSFAGNKFAVGVDSLFFRVQVSDSFDLARAFLGFQFTGQNNASWSNLRGDVVPAFRCISPLNTVFISNYVPFPNDPQHTSQYAIWGPGYNFTPTCYPGSDACLLRGTDTVALFLTLHIPPSALGGTVCIDTVASPFEDSWEWVTTDSGYYSPNFAGPYCLTVHDCCLGMKGSLGDNPAANPTVQDLIRFVSYLFNSGPSPLCKTEADLNNSGTLTVADLVRLVAFLFNGAQGVPCPQ